MLGGGGGHFFSHQETSFARAYHTYGIIITVRLVHFWMWWYCCFTGERSKYALVWYSRHSINNIKSFYRCMVRYVKELLSKAQTTPDLILTHTERYLVIYFFLHFKLLSLTSFTLEVLIMTSNVLQSGNLTHYNISYVFFSGWWQVVLPLSPKPYEHYSWKEALNVKHLHNPEPSGSLQGNIPHSAETGVAALCKTCLLSWHYRPRLAYPALSTECCALNCFVVKLIVPGMY